MTGVSDKILLVYQDLLARQRQYNRKCNAWIFFCLFITTSHFSARLEKNPQSNVQRFEIFLLWFVNFSANQRANNSLAYDWQNIGKPQKMSNIHVVTVIYLLVLSALNQRQGSLTTTIWTPLYLDTLITQNST